MKNVPLRILLLTVVAGVALIGWQAVAETNRTTFPANIDQLVHYTTVTRGEVTEHMLTTPEAIAAVKNGQPIPNGTHFVLVDYRQGEVFRYFVMERGDGWGAEYPEDRRTGDWQFQWFEPDRSVNMAENTARCQSCHQGRSGSEFLFTYDRILDFDGAMID
ncbi:cytochrome P460 family protein [Pararhizobium sp. A13]|uniref:cytochrome P460 family protein n=1 Tax=Pararhizobium sp. A13 TaxID=3133975 RepID=UPI003251C193